MAISFGIEFEFDVIERYDQSDYDIFDRCFERGYLTVGNWDYQTDPTAGVELRSPVFTNLENAIEEIKREFSYWIRELPNCSPYPFNRRGRSLGQHIHLGVPNRRLTSATKRKIAIEIAKIYPYLAALHAQPIPSIRGLRSQYCRSIHLYYYDIPNSDHYCEISDSHHGTIEFRIFDSNVPQVSLTCAWIMKALAEKILRRSVEDLDNNFRSHYPAERSNALQYGPMGINVGRYLSRIKEVLGNVELPNIPAIREILFISARYGINPYGLLRRVIGNSLEKQFEYFRLAFTNPDKLADNLLEVCNRRNREFLEDIKARAMEIENLDQLIGIARASLEALVSAVSSSRLAIERAARAPSRRAVRELLLRERYAIARIRHVPYMTDYDVARRISELLREHGEGYVREMSADEIIQAPERFYVFVVREHNDDSWHILGAIAVRIRTGEICHLVVDRRYRRLGIGRRLLRYALDELRDHNAQRAIAYVRHGNEASLSLFKSCGFRVVGSRDRCVILEANLRK